MTPESLSVLADIILYLHAGVVAFNVFGLVAVPLGAWLGWRFVRVFWWRALHLGLLGAVAVQAVFGRACFLTLLQYSLEEQVGAGARSTPLIQDWITRLIFWPLPMWFFTVLYVAVLIYAGALWYWVRPIRKPKTAA